VDWSDPEGIGMALFDAHPEVDPLSVRFTQLREWILQLPGFRGDPASSTEGKLEAVQMAWYEEWKDAR